MVGNCCAVVVGDGETAFLVNEVTDEGGVEDEILRAHFVAGHSLCEGSDFGGGEGGVVNTNFGGIKSVHIICPVAAINLRDYGIKYASG